MEDPKQELLHELEALQVELQALGQLFVRLCAELEDAHRAAKRIQPPR